MKPALIKIFNKLTEQVGTKPFKQIVEEFIDELTCAAYWYNDENCAHAAEFLKLQRTTLQGILLRKKRIVPRKREQGDSHNRNYGVVRQRLCNQCHLIFESDFTKPCPGCGNSDRRTLKAYKDRRKGREC